MQDFPIVGVGKCFVGLVLAEWVVAGVSFGFVVAGMPGIVASVLGLIRRLQEVLVVLVVVAWVGVVPIAEVVLGAGELARAVGIAGVAVPIAVVFEVVELPDVVVTDTT